MSALTLDRLANLERVAEYTRLMDRADGVNGRGFNEYMRVRSDGRKPARPWGMGVQVAHRRVTQGPKRVVAPSFRAEALGRAAVPVRRDGLERDYYPGVDPDTDTSRVRVRRIVNAKLKMLAEMGYTYEQLREIARKRGWDLPEPAGQQVFEGQLSNGAEYRVEYEAPVRNAVAVRPTEPVTLRVSDAPRVPEARAYDWRTREPLFY